MKKFPKIVLALFVFFVLLAGSWLGVNLWPRPVEPPLWTEADLSVAVTEEKDKNGYYFLVKARQDGDTLDSWDVEDLPETLLFLYELDAVPSMKDADAFWTEVKRRRPRLAAFLKDRRATVEGYRALLEFPQMIDRDPLRLGEQSAPWISLLGLHKVGVLTMADLAAGGDVAEAYRTWIRQYRQDLSHLSAARGMISHLVAMADVKSDLFFSCKLLGLPAPAALKEEMKAAMAEFDPAKVTFRRAMVAEYLHGLAAAESLEAEQKQAGRGLWFRIIFNRAAYRKDTNDYFRRLEALAADPKSLTEDEIGRHRASVEALTRNRGPLWWFYNPLGKILRRLVTVDPLAYVKEFADSKEEIRRMTDGTVWPPCSAQP
ncbi:MAG TPA: hypothetical protein VFX30_02945 [bacterium]|nr:hypothetical protein [bacterium]